MSIYDFGGPCFISLSVFLLEADGVESQLGRSGIGKIKKYAKIKRYECTATEQNYTLFINLVLTY